MSDGIAQAVGVNISKDMLDVHLHPAGLARRFVNTPKGRRALIAWLAEVTVTRVAFEPTGADHHDFERHLAEAGLPLCKINPRQTGRFAGAIGRQAKTDVVDAAMLARLAAMIEPPIRPVIQRWARRDEGVARRSQGLGEGPHGRVLGTLVSDVGLPSWPATARPAPAPDSRAARPSTASRPR